MLKCFEMSLKRSVLVDMVCVELLPVVQTTFFKDKVERAELSCKKSQRPPHTSIMHMYSMLQQRRCAFQADVFWRMRSSLGAAEDESTGRVFTVDIIGCKLIASHAITF